jgi:phenylalanyl-tRNA synthetase beta chain
MLISLNWLKDFIDLPPNLDPRELALKFTLTTAEVDGVEHVEPNFTGLVAAKIEAIDAVADEDTLKRVTVSADKRYTSLTTAPDLTVGDLVIYAPPGAAIAGHPVGTTDPLGRPSEGMIIAGQSIGLMQVGANAMFLPPSFESGQPIDAALFDDWLIEIENKSITHRPDCWGHYGIAREVAAILGVPLKAYDVTDPAELESKDLSEIPIEIDDPAFCPRYTGLLMRGLKSQPAPLWMQARLALCGQRPIDLLVDLTNYIMLELGQPMHAFDGAALPNIQVATAAPGERFTTLDGVTRTLPPNTLMIQCGRRSVAIAGIMGGAETEVSAKTETVLLESANFDAATVRRAATAMGHRTEASARFEKSLDPEHTVLGIARFHKLAKQALPGLQLASTLSDCYPVPKVPRPIELDCDFATRLIGKAVTPEEITRILTALEFKCERLDADKLHRRDAGATNKLLVTPPSYRATKDIEIAEDLIEEVARFVGYNNIEPVLPNVAARFFEKAPDLVIEERTLHHLCLGKDFVEVQNYIWYNDDWLQTLGLNSGDCLTLKNPIAENCSRFRKTLMPGLIAMAERNRHHFTRFQLVEIGTVFEPSVWHRLPAGGASRSGPRPDVEIGTVFEPGQTEVEQAQHRNLGLVVAQAGKKADATVWDRLRAALDAWSRQVLESPLAYKETKAVRPWEDPDRLGEIVVAGRTVGRVTILPLACKQRIDERLKAWSIALAELDLTALTDLAGRYEKLPPVPKHPQVRLDFSVLADAAVRYADTQRKLAEFNHPLLKRLSFVDAYQGGSIPTDKRSVTFRANIGLDERTLTDEEIRAFQTAFKDFLTSAGMVLRG